LSIHQVLLVVLSKNVDNCFVHVYKQIGIYFVGCNHVMYVCCELYNNGTSVLFCELWTGKHNRK
jgi:hypothetical protein